MVKKEKNNHSLNKKCLDCGCPISDNSNGRCIPCYLKQKRENPGFFNKAYFANPSKARY